MMPGMKCCKNKRIDIKIKDAHQGQVQSFLSKVFSLKLTAVNYVPAFLLPQPLWLDRFYDRGPPDKLAAVTPVFIKHCNFRI